MSREVILNQMPHGSPVELIVRVRQSLIILMEEYTSFTHTLARVHNIAKARADILEIART